MMITERNKLYPSYIETGINWIPRIPSGWQMKKINDLFIERKEKVSDRDYAPLSVTKFGVLPQIDTAVKTKDGDNRKKFVLVILLSTVVQIDVDLAVFHR